jgi:hypothetical protein
MIALMTEAASTSETSVNFYVITRRDNPEDHQLHTLRREILKSPCYNFPFYEFCHPYCINISSQDKIFYAFTMFNFVF